MIPLNTWTATPVHEAFLPPLTDSYDPLLMRITGGSAIGDGTQGREVQFWTVSYAGGVITVEPSLVTPNFTMAVAGVLSVSAAFDAAMAVTVAYLKADGAYLYFYNSLTSAYETLHISGVTSCRLTLDKASKFYAAQSDVMLFYITAAGNLCWRQQRDHYATEYIVGTATGELTRVGPTLGNRLQCQVKNGVITVGGSTDGVILGEDDSFIEGEDGSLIAFEF